MDLLVPFLAGCLAMRMTARYWSIPVPPAGTLRDFVAYLDAYGYIIVKEVDIDALIARAPIPPGEMVSYEHLTSDPELLAVYKAWKDKP